MMFTKQTSGRWGGMVRFGVAEWLMLIETRRYGVASLRMIKFSMVCEFLLQLQCGQASARLS